MSMSSFSRATKLSPLAAAVFAAVIGKSARCVRVMFLLRLSDDPLLLSRLRCHREDGSKELEKAISTIDLFTFHEQKDILHSHSPR